MNLREQYEKETGEALTESEGLYEYFTHEYVEWLEKQHKDFEMFKKMYTDKCMELKEQIENMKCCENCKHTKSIEVWFGEWQKRCVSKNRDIFDIPEGKCKYWELEE